MTPSNRTAIWELAPIADIGLLFCCLGLSFVTTVHRPVFDVLNSLETRYPIQVFVATVVLGLSWYAVLRANGFYRPRRLAGSLRETLDVCTACSLCALLSCGWLWLVNSHSIYRTIDLAAVAVLFGIMSFAALLTTRLIA